MELSADSTAVVTEAMNTLKSGGVAQAIAILEKASSDYPDDPQVFTCLGVACNANGDKSGAVDAFEKALALGKSAKSYYNLGLAYEAAGRTDDALAQYREALALDSGYAAAAQAIGRLAPAAPAVEPTVAVQAPPSAPISPEPTIVSQASVALPANPNQTVMDADPDFSPIQDIPLPPPDFSRQAYERELRFAQQRKDYVKAAVLYGIGCGAGLLLLVRLLLIFLVDVTVGGGPAALEVIAALIEGAIMGGLVGWWIGFTCGDDMQGLLAGAVMGGVYGLIDGLAAGLGPLALFRMGYCALLGAIFGFIIGKWVTASIAD